MRSEYKVESSSMWIFLVCLPFLFFPPVSYSDVPLQSINCFCSSRRLIASLLASFALVRRHYCSCSSSCPFCFSPSIASALLFACSASVRRLFLLFSSIIASFLASFALVRRLFLLFWSPVLLQSVKFFCSIF